MLILTIRWRVGVDGDAGRGELGREGVAQAAEGPLGRAVLSTVYLGRVSLRELHGVWPG